MEKEPRREPTRYFVDYSGERYILGPNNTLIYLHDNKDFDHIYVQFKDSDDGEQQGTYMWRLDPRYTEQFEMMVSNLISIDTTTIQQKEVSAFDLEQWTKRFGTTATVPQNDPTNELDWISPRSQRDISKAVGFLIYLAENGRL